MEVSRIPSVTDALQRAGGSPSPWLSASSVERLLTS